jgi:predicted transcriptional regulator
MTPARRDEIERLAPLLHAEGKSTHEMARELGVTVTDVEDALKHANAPYLCGVRDERVQAQMTERYTVGGESYSLSPLTRGQMLELKARAGVIDAQVIDAAYESLGLKPPGYPAKLKTEKGRPLDVIRALLCFGVPLEYVEDWYSLTTEVVWRDADRREVIRHMWRQGRPVREIAWLLDVTPSAIAKATTDMPRGSRGAKRTKRKDAAASADVVAQIRDLYARGYRRSTLATVFGLSYSNVYARTRDLSSEHGDPL